MEWALLICSSIFYLKNQRERSDSAFADLGGDINASTGLEGRNTCSPAAWVLKNVSLYCLSWFSMGVGRKIVWFAKARNYRQ